MTSTEQCQLTAAPVVISVAATSHIIGVNFLGAMGATAPIEMGSVGAAHP